MYCKRCNKEREVKVYDSLISSGFSVRQYHCVRCNHIIKTDWLYPTTRKGEVKEFKHIKELIKDKLDS